MKYCCDHLVFLWSLNSWVGPFNRLLRPLNAVETVEYGFGVIKQPVVGIQKAIKAI